MGLSKIFRSLTRSLVYVFFILIVGYFVLNFLANRFSGNAVGAGATWVEQHSAPY